MPVTWEQIAEVASELAEEAGEWCGAPVPVDDLRLSIAPGYTFGKLDGFRFKEDEYTEGEELKDTLAEAIESRVINSWWCARRGGWVFVLKGRGGKSRHLIVDGYATRPVETLTRLLMGLSVCEVQKLDAEFMAMDKLRSMVKPHLFKMYIIQNILLETSPKSGVTYILRKGRPTIAMKADGNGNMRILSVLCLHPLGYYEGSFCGCMVPTDELIAHLIMIRANEHFFWRKANHHRSYEWESGL